MPGRLRANDCAGCLFFLTARSAEADFRQEIQDSGKYFLEHHFPQAVAVTRGQGQSPALEGSEQANFRVTSPFPRGGRFRKSGRLETALRPDVPRRELSANVGQNSAENLSPGAVSLSVSHPLFPKLFVGAEEALKNPTTPRGYHAVH